MKKIRKIEEQAQPALDVESLLTLQAKTLTEQTTAMVTAMRDEMRNLTAMVVDAKKGPVRVEIERDRSGKMTAMNISRRLN